MNLELIYDHFARGDNYTLVELIKNANRYGGGRRPEHLSAQ